MAKYLSGSGNVVKCCIFKILDGTISEQYDFKYNFGELNQNLGAEYNLLTPPGSFLPTAIYKNSPGNDLSFSFLLDATERFMVEGIVPDISFFQSLITPDIALALDAGARWTSPARLVLVVGERSWDVVCTNVSIKETMHNRDLTPIRATVDISLKTIYVGVEETRRYLIEMRNNYSERVIL
jgi:hypothetical protein